MAATKNGNVAMVIVIIYLRNCICCKGIYGCKFIDNTKDNKYVIERDCKKCCLCSMPEHNHWISEVSIENTTGLCKACLEKKRAENAKKKMASW